MGAGRGGHRVPWMVIGRQRGMPSVPRQRFGGGAVWLAPPSLPFFVAVVAVVIVVIAVVVIVIAVVVVVVAVVIVIVVVVVAIVGVSLGCYVVVVVVVVVRDL